MWVFRFYPPPPPSASSSFFPPSHSPFSSFSTTLFSPTIFLHFPTVSDNFLPVFSSHCIQTLHNLVSPSLMLSHSVPCCFNRSSCNFFLFFIIVWFSFLPHNQSILERSYVFCNIFPGVIYPLSLFFSVLHLSPSFMPYKFSSIHINTQLTWKSSWTCQYYFSKFCSITGQT